MSKPRNLHKVALLALVLSGLGCREKTERVPESEQFLSAGKRMVLQDTEGEILFKVRKRTTHYRVYDESLRLTGRVRSAETGVRVESLSGKDSVSVQNEQLIDLPGFLRLEAMESDWAVFDSETRLVGYVGQNGSEWHFKRKWGESVEFSARPHNAGAEIVEGEKQIASSVTLTPAMALAGRISELDPLGRAALGVLLERGK